MTQTVFQWGSEFRTMRAQAITMRREYSQQKIWWVGCAKMKRFQNYRIRNDDLRQPLVISKYLLYVIHTKSFRPKTTMEGGRYGEHGKGWGRRVTKNGSGRSVSACRPNGPCVIIITSAPMQKSYFYTLPFVPPRAFLDPHPHASALRISTYTHRTSRLPGG